MTDRKSNAYGSDKPSKVIGAFQAGMNAPGKTLPAVEFLAIEEDGETNLAKQTATDLGILSIKADIKCISIEQLLRKYVSVLFCFVLYDSCLEGIGKLIDFQLKISIAKNVTPVCQPLCRVPYHIRDSLTKKRKQLESLDISSNCRAKIR